MNQLRTSPRAVGTVETTRDAVECCILRAWQAYARKARSRRDQRLLEETPEAVLKDIGLTRGEVYHIIGRNDG